MDNEKYSLGIITFPIENANVNPLRNLVRVIQAITENYSLILPLSSEVSFQHDEPDKVQILEYRVSDKTINKIWNYFWCQVRSAYCLWKMNDVGIWFFYIGDSLLIPGIVAKLLGKKTILIMGGYAEEEVNRKGKSLQKFVVYLKKINLRLFDKIVLYSPRLIPLWNLEQYDKKILIAHEHFLDTNVFYSYNQLSHRPLLVGYLGRLSQEKGIINFLDSIDLIRQSHPGVRFIIGGDGELRGEVEDRIAAGGITDYVTYLGWIAHDDLPHLLNNLSLLVIPSHTEGLPNILLEALACGTPILTTPVGAVPDIINEKETGFIIKKNSPKCIAENAIRTLNSPYLEQITENGRHFVEEHFTYKKTVEMWEMVLRGIE